MLFGDDDANVAERAVGAVGVVPGSSPTATTSRQPSSGWNERWQVCERGRHEATTDQLQFACTRFIRAHLTVGVPGIIVTWLA